ncbi:hypothetical protein QBC37DRAFT_405897 [Rhypophila decipiens]|uniref:UBC core domain-containing protein n=1 Tax=Rhypophila decipiens TaxID=261697 RepID=A0AAN6XVM3_9PEZI|nr:hypothetical protein QBC37DRAFT_405897 [Rhypophila decipiens]
MAKRRYSDEEGEVQNSQSKQARVGKTSKTPAAAAAAQTAQSSMAKGASSSSRCEQPDPGSSIDNPIDLTESCASDKDPLSLHAHCSPTMTEPNIAHGLKPLLEDGFDPQWAFPDTTIKDISPREMLQAHGRRMTSVKCRTCTSGSLTGPSIVAKRFERTVPGSASGTAADCSGCRIRFCSECGNYAKYFSEPVITTIHPECYREVRLRFIFCLLCGPYSETPSTFQSKKKLTLRQYIEHTKQKVTGKSKLEAEQSIPKQGNTSSQNSPKAPSHSSAFAKGTGYGHQPVENPLRKAVGSKPNTNSTYGIPNKQLEAHFKALAALLPNEKATTEYDRGEGRHDLLTAMISRSPLIFAALELLRNDSMEEIAGKARLYNALLDFLEAVTRHEDTRWSLLVAQRLYPLDQQLAAVTFCEAAQDVSALETTSSVALTLEKLSRSCQFFQSKASIHTRELREDQGLKLARRICALADSLTVIRKKAEPQRNRQAAIYLSSSGSAAAQISAARFGEEQRSQEREWLAKDAAAWHAEHRVEEIPDDEFWPTFDYEKEAKSLSEGSVCKGRMKKLITQLSSLRNSLPEGIYVRHASSRLDVMKVLFVGPSGTPYEGGLFEFDLFCGANFPDKPPQMQLRTTGGGKVRFNPNLYACGKVCLSLLGTWSQGQEWIPGQSSLEQLLVSIQAMIFCEQPWYNEPGYEQRPDQARSDNYNRSIQIYTVRYAMMHWLCERLCQEQPAPPTRENNDNDDPFTTDPSKPPPTAGKSSATPFMNAVVGLVNDPHAMLAEYGHLIPTELLPTPLAAAVTKAVCKEPKPIKTGCKEDDKIWGPVIRHHFASRGGAILEQVVKWEKMWRPGSGGFGYSSELRVVLRAGKFIE